MKNLDIRRVHKPFVPQNQSVLSFLPPERQSHFSFKKYIIFPFTLVILVIGAFLGSRFIYFANSISVPAPAANFYQNISNNIGSVLGSSVPILKNLDQSAIAVAERQGSRINILLLGYGGEGHDGAYLTDSMMLVSIDFANSKVAFISVPRDIWIKIPTRGYDGAYAKINAAYPLGLDQRRYPYKLPQFSGVRGAGNLSKYTVSEVVGMPVDYYVSADFSGFKKVVDILAGVNVNVDNAFTDYSYPTEDENANGPFCVAEDNTPTACRYKKIHFDAGPQFMDGERALEYVRSRHASGAEGSDFARSKRQQKLIAAIQEKALRLNMLPKALELMNAISGHFQSDLSLADIKDLSEYLAAIDFNSASRLSITDFLVAGRSADNQWILTPRRGMNDWQEVHDYLRSALSGAPRAADETGS